MLGRDVDPEELQWAVNSFPDVRPTVLQIADLLAAADEGAPESCYSYSSDGEEDEYDMALYSPQLASPSVQRAPIEDSMGEGTPCDGGVGRSTPSIPTLKLGSLKKNLMKVMPQVPNGTGCMHGTSHLHAGNTIVVQFLLSMASRTGLACQQLLTTTPWLLLHCLVVCQVTVALNCIQSHVLHSAYAYWPCMAGCLP